MFEGACSPAPSAPQGATQAPRHWARSTVTSSLQKSSLMSSSTKSLRGRSATSAANQASSQFSRAAKSQQNRSAQGLQPGRRVPSGRTVASASMGRLPK
eukprot:4023119-Lingulodinium_polyedra.AAC.1